MLELDRAVVEEGVVEQGAEKPWPLPELVELTTGEPAEALPLVMAAAAANLAANSR